MPSVSPYLELPLEHYTGARKFHWHPGVCVWGGGDKDLPSTFYRYFFHQQEVQTPTDSDPASFIRTLEHSCTRCALRGAKAGIQIITAAHVIW